MWQPERSSIPRPWRIGFCLCVATWAGEASAQPAQGTIGERSRASIQISVSVAPAFRKQVRERDPDAPSLSLKSVDPAFRYSVLSQPLQDGTDESPGTLLLIVPD